MNSNSLIANACRILIRHFEGVYHGKGEVVYTADGMNNTTYVVTIRKKEASNATIQTNTPAST